MAAAALVLVVVMFLVIFVGRSVIQKRRTGDTGVRTGALSAPPWTAEGLAGWLFVVALVAAVAAPIVELLGWEPLTSSGWVRGAGLAIAVVGLLLTFLAQLDMGSEWRIGVDADEQTGLVTDGSFALVRNPIFATMLVSAIGLALMVPNVIAIAGAVALLVSIELQVRLVEEPHLRHLHGQTYAAYESSVGRFLPRPRPRKT